MTTPIPSPDAATIVVVYVDPVCPYAWITSRWLEEVSASRPLKLRYNVMSLRMLNEGGTQSPAYVENTVSSAGPSRVFTAAAVHFGGGYLQDLYAAFGRRWFDRWRRPIPEYLRPTLGAALADVGLPTLLIEAADTDTYDPALRDSHNEAVAGLGRGAGTPILHVDGVAWFGPVLNTIPRGREALDLYDAFTVLATHPDYFEMKRARSTGPRLDSSELAEISAQ